MKKFIASILTLICVLSFSLTMTACEKEPETVSDPGWKLVLQLKSTKTEDVDRALLELSNRANAFEPYFQYTHLTDENDDYTGRIEIRLIGITNENDALLRICDSSVTPVVTLRDTSGKTVLTWEDMLVTDMLGDNYFDGETLIVYVSEEGFEVCKNDEELYFYLGETKYPDLNVSFYALPLISPSSGVYFGNNKSVRGWLTVTNFKSDEEANILVTALKFPPLSVEYEIVESSPID